HSQRIESIGTLAGGVAHDMNNILMAVIGLAESARESPATADADLEGLIAAAERGAALTRSLLVFSRRSKQRTQQLEPGAMIQSALDLLSRTLPRTVAITTAFDHGGAAIVGDAAHLGQAIINLCINASDAMAGTGALHLATRTLALDERAATA